MAEENGADRLLSRHQQACRRGSRSGLVLVCPEATRHRFTPARRSHPLPTWARVLVQVDRTFRYRGRCRRPSVDASVRHARQASIDAVLFRCPRRPASDRRGAGVTELDRGRAVRRISAGSVRPPLSSSASTRASQSLNRCRHGGRRADPAQRQKSTRKRTRPGG